jgi:hypothetical protein
MINLTDKQGLLEKIRKLFQDLMRPMQSNSCHNKSNARSAIPLC